MKRWKVVVGALALSAIVLGCKTAKTSSDNAATADSAAASKKLIVYYSLTGNTKFAAEHIQTLTGADVFELKLADPYPAEFEPSLERAKQDKESGVLPKLEGGIDNLADYDVIFIGYPNWFGTIALPALSFLESHDLSGKTLVPFVTFGRGGFQNTVTDLKARYPGNKILEEFGVAGADVKENLAGVSEWLRKIGMLK